MQIDIKSFMSPDILDLNNFIPSDKLCFSFLLELEIGIKGKVESDVFSFQVCTPKWLQENHESSDIVFLSRKLIVFEFNIVNLIDKVNAYLCSIPARSWEDVVSEISKTANWEFDHYN